MEEEFDVCRWCCEWHSEMEGKSPFVVRDAYPRMMRKVLRHEFHMSKRAAKDFVEDACQGNWERLHETGTERRVIAEEFAAELLSEVWYCSDRWSWDRVLRVQWLYKRLEDRCYHMEACI